MFYLLVKFADLEFEYSIISKYITIKVTKNIPDILKTTTIKILMNN